MIEAAVAVGAVSATGFGAKSADGDVVTSARGSKERKALSILVVEVAVLAIEGAIAACCRVRYGAGFVLEIELVCSGIYPTSLECGRHSCCVRLRSS